MFRERSADVGEGRPRGVLAANISRLSNAGWIITKILHIFNVNERYLSNNAASRNPICFRVVRPNEYIQIYDLSTTRNGFRAEAET